MRTMKCSIALCVAVLACGSTNGRDASSGNVALRNPTGSCTAPDDGSRAGYHSPGNSTWLPDCQNVLKREYWRVFAQSATSAYIIPRPDNVTEFVAACADPAHPLYELAQKYLCHSAGPDGVARINDMDPADALTIGHYLHTKLEFVSYDTDIVPFALPSDVIDACELHADTNSAELEAICKRERDRLASGQEIGFDYTGPGAIELAVRLNELYGITPAR